MERGRLRDLLDLMRRRTAISESWLTSMKVFLVRMMEEEHDEKLLHRTLLMSGADGIRFRLIASSRLTLVIEAVCSAIVIAKKIE